MKEYLKKILPYLAILALFVGMSVVYMLPELKGEKIGAADNINAVSAMGEELNYTAETGKQSWWNGAMFCGMPDYQIGGADYESTKLLSPLMKIFRSGYGSPICLMLIYLCCFFTLMLSMKMGKWLSLIGAIALAFSSYFIIIIGASHVVKATTIAFMTLALAGFYLIFHNYRKTGVCLCMLGTAAGFSPHPQMTYYICFLFGAFGIAELWIAFKTKVWKSFVINCVLAFASLGIGAGTSLANTFANMEYVKETVRGGASELKTPEKHVQTGLDYTFATEYSYGVDECLTFLIPNYMGGSNKYNLKLSEKEVSRMISEGVMESEVRLFSNSANMYWGEQTTTSGPVYFGAVVIFLFVLGLFVVKGPYKWALLIVSLLSVLLSLGYHFEVFTKLFFDYFPLFNKFRAVSSILIIAEIAVPILAIMCLKEIMTALENNEISKAKLKKYILYTTAITAGICFAVLVGASLFASFHKSTEALAGADGQINMYVNDLIYYRKSLFYHDVWRSIGLILASAAIMLTYIYGKLKKKWMLTLMGIIIAFDLWSVDKRYFNDSLFSTPEDYSAAFAMQPWEKEILDKDHSPSYRVVNTAADPAYAARTSLRLKSVGGYHAAKLRRYEDIIDEHLSKSHMPIYNMLNTKYVIEKDSNDSIVVLKNDSAMGNAWFVEKLVTANTPRQECDDLMKVDIYKTAIVGKDFVSSVKNMNPGSDSSASIMMTKYEPDCVYYDAKCSKPGTIVFSEIYYPYGWKAYVDDKPVDHYRVNYLLRALNIEPGNHKIRFEFRPESVEKGDTIARVCVMIMYITLIICPIWWIAEQIVVYRRRRNESK